MKEKEKRTAGSGGRLARGLLLTVLFMILSAGLVAVPASGKILLPLGIRNTGRINDKKDGKDQTGGFQWEIYP